MSDPVEMLKKLVRTTQVHVPWLVDAKFDALRAARRALKRPFEPDFAALGQMRLGAGEVALDIGGNRGQSVDAIRLAWPDAHIISFEPHPQLAARISRLFAGDPRVEVRALGLGDEAGAFMLHAPTYGGLVYDGLASFDANAARDWLSPRTIYGFDAAKLGVETVECRVETLDSQALSPGFIKIDVQGFEARVMRGGFATITRLRPVLLIENDDTVGSSGHEPLLGALGYRRYGWTGTALIPGEGDTNSFYVAQGAGRGLEALIRDAQA